MHMSKDTATLAGGCFWCTEAVFKRLKGIISVTPGYAGGITENPIYEAVSSGNTGYAEAIQVEYDPSQISYEKILDIFWHTHNSTTINRQGSDVGTQYQSVIFYHNDEQKNVAESSKQAFAREGEYRDPIVTEIIPFTNFYSAEDYHKNYFDTHKNAAYCDIVISPKIHKLLEKYKNDVKDEYKKKS